MPKWRKTSYIKFKFSCVYLYFHILLPREEKVHKCHIPQLSVLRNALTRNGGTTFLLEGVYFVYTTSISYNWIPGIPAC